MKSFKEIVNDIESFEDSSFMIEKVNDTTYRWHNSKNNSVMLEASFNRLVDLLANSTYAILTAYRKVFTKKENILRNRKLRNILDKYHMGVYQLVGHWLETPEGVAHEDATPDQLTDSIERSYAVKKPESMSDEEFKSIMIDCMTIDGSSQDGCIFYRENEDAWYFVTPTGKETKIGSKLTYNKIGQAYSCWVKKADKPFIFEFVERPDSNSGKLLYKLNNLKYI